MCRPGARMKMQGVSLRHVTEPTSLEQAFRFHDGRTAHSLVEFHERLRESPAQLVDDHRDHFAMWVRGILLDVPLALRIESYAKMRPEPETLREILTDLVAGRIRDLKAAEPTHEN